MKQAGPDFESLLGAVKGIATDVAARHAADVDAQARFPHETVDALKRSQLMSAPVPRILGGSGCTMRELALLCATLAQACGSSAMVLAMHYIQVACIARHAGDSRFFAGYLRELVEQAAAFSGAADDALVSQRIADQEALLERLTEQRDRLAQAKR